MKRILFALLGVALLFTSASAETIPYQRLVNGLDSQGFYVLGELNIDISEKADADSLLEATWTNPVLIDFLQLHVTKNTGNMVADTTTGFEVYFKYTADGNFISAQSYYRGNGVTMLQGPDAMILDVHNVLNNWGITWAVPPGPVGDWDSSADNPDSHWGGANREYSSYPIYGVRIEWFENGAEESGSATFDLNAILRKPQVKSGSGSYYGLIDEDLGVPYPGEFAEGSWTLGNLNNQLTNVELEHQPQYITAIDTALASVTTSGTWQAGAYTLDYFEAVSGSWYTDPALTGPGTANYWSSRPRYRNSNKFGKGYIYQDLNLGLSGVAKARLDSMVNFLSDEQVQSSMVGTGGYTSGDVGGWVSWEFRPAAETPNLLDRTITVTDGVRDNRVRTYGTARAITAISMIWAHNKITGGSTPDDFMRPRYRAG